MVQKTDIKGTGVPCTGVPDAGGKPVQHEANAAPILAPQCPACGRPESIIWVHGHGQCAHCRMNVMPCCDGETCGDG
mgnify:CR=1 FL=1